MAYNVVIDSELEDLIPGYLENRKKDIEKIEASLGQSDFETIRVTGHSMKGSGGGYGFDRISEIGRSIEEAAKTQDVATIKTGINNLDDYIKNVNVSFE